MFGLMYWVSCLFFIFRFALKLQSLLSYFHFTPKWGSCFQLKTLKMRFYCFHFLVVSCFHFYWKCFQKSNQTHFHHHFLFSVKIKTENSQTKHPLLSDLISHRREMFSYPFFSITWRSYMSQTRTATIYFSILNIDLSFNFLL